MSEPHVIRLREPWDCSPLDASRVLWVRRFGRPSGLDPGVHVWINLRAAAEVQMLRLNGESVDVGQAANGTIRWEATDLLRERNELQFESLAPLTFEVWLEIVEPA